MSRTTPSAIVLVAAVLGGSSSAQPPPLTPQPQSDEQCPPFIRGARLALEDIDGGVAFTITAKSPESVAPLRAMLRRIALLLEHYSALAPTGAPRDPDEIPPIDVGVRDIVSGAHVTVTAERTQDTANVRAHARQVEALWATSQCINGEVYATRGIPL